MNVQYVNDNEITSLLCFSPSIRFYLMWLGCFAFCLSSIMLCIWVHAYECIGKALSFYRIIKKKQQQQNYIEESHVLTDIRKIKKNVFCVISSALCLPYVHYYDAQTWRGFRCFFLLNLWSWMRMCKHFLLLLLLLLRCLRPFVYVYDMIRFSMLPFAGGWLSF